VGSPATAGGLSDFSRGFSASARYFNALAIVVPFVAFGVAVALLWNGLVDTTDLAILGVGYVLTTLGITMGFHRLLTHRSFETHPSIRVTLAVLGSMAVEGPPLVWVADHRKHHAHADEEGDPHSPHTGGETGWRGVIKGLYHAHIGWLLNREQSSDPLRYAKDLTRDRAILHVSRLFGPIVLAGLLIPAAAGFLIEGTPHAAFTGLLWGGFVRIFFVHHMTWSVNSLGHYYGRRRFATSDRSSNLLALALPSLGDSWHHNHHAFPRSASHGLRWWEVDITGLLIRLMERAGLVWNVVRVSEERQRAKELAPV
jgi:stearoyl-CoA desaturase (Delta-9 desaturase)